MKSHLSHIDNVMSIVMQKALLYFRKITLWWILRCWISSGHTKQAENFYVCFLNEIPKGSACWLGNAASEHVSYKLFSPLLALGDQLKVVILGR